MGEKDGLDASTGEAAESENASKPWPSRGLGRVVFFSSVPVRGVTCSPPRRVGRIVC